MSTTWNRLRHHAGVLVRHSSGPAPRDEPSARDRAREARRREPLPYIDWPAITRIVARSGMELGGEIADVIESRDTFILVGGALVAARRLVVYVEFDADGGGESGLSDAITITLHRDPANPRWVVGAYL